MRLCVQTTDGALFTFEEGIDVTSMPDGIHIRYLGPPEDSPGPAAVVEPVERIMVFAYDRVEGYWFDEDDIPPMRRAFDRPSEGQEAVSRLTSQFIRNIPKPVAKCTVCNGDMEDWGYRNWRHIPSPEMDAYLSWHNHDATDIWPEGTSAAAFQELREALRELCDVIGRTFKPTWKPNP